MFGVQIHSISKVRPTNLFQENEHDTVEKNLHQLFNQLSCMRACSRQAHSCFSWLVVLPNTTTMLVLLNAEILWHQRCILAKSSVFLQLLRCCILLTTGTWILHTLRCHGSRRTQQHAAASIPRCQPGSHWHCGPKERIPSPCCHLCRPVQKRRGELK